MQNALFVIHKTTAKKLIKVFLNYYLWNVKWIKYHHLHITRECVFSSFHHRSIWVHLRIKYFLITCGSHTPILSLPLSYTHTHTHRLIYSGCLSPWFQGYFRVPLLLTTHLHQTTSCQLTNHLSVNTHTSLSIRVMADLSNNRIIQHTYTDRQPLYHKHPAGRARSALDVWKLSNNS